MKKCAALGFAFLSTFALGSEQYLLLPAFVPVLARHVQPSQMLYFEEGVSLVKVPTAEIDAWSQRVHEALGGCGGFLDVTSEIEAGRAPASLVWEEIRWRARERPHRAFDVVGEPMIADLVSKASADKWWEIVEELSKFPDRSATTANGTKAAQFLKARAEKLGEALPGFTTFTVETNTASYKKQPSVVARYPGKDPSLPHVVLGGHMDTFSPTKPGADDDGSGSGSVMEALRVISEHKAGFDHTIDFIWYSAEERGLVGSRHVVEHYKKQRTPVKSVLQLDMVGFKSPKDGADVYLMTDNTDEALNSALKKILETYTSAKVGETRCGYPCSDHVNWTRNGFAAAFPFESDFTNMNKKIHTGDDGLKYLDKEHALLFVKLALAYLGEMARLRQL